MAKLNTRIVLRHDKTANWEASEAGLLKEGEVGLEFAEGGKVKMKVGDGVKTWKELPYIGAEEAQVFQVNATLDHLDDITAIEETVGEAELHAGDMAIVKRVFGENKTSYTAYVHNGETWEAMDGNYKADNVYFDQDLQTTTPIGYITLTNGQAQVPAKGKNLNEVWQQIFVQAKDPEVDQPTATLSGTGLQYIEIGQSGNASITASLDSDGKYEFGQINNEGSIINNGSTGVTATGYHMTYGSQTFDTQTAQVASGVKTTRAEGIISGKVTYSDGNVPVNNVGEKRPGLKISGSTISAGTKTLFRWYIPMYSGFTYDKAVIANPAKITSEEVKGLSSITGATAYNKTVPTTAKAVKSWMQWFVAVPSEYGKNISGAKDSNNLTLTVSKANDVTINYNGTDVVYNVWYINNASAYDTKDITITW